MSTAATPGQPGLAPADREADHLTAASHGEPASGGAVTAADVEHPVVAAQARVIGQVSDEPFLSGARRCSGRRPEAVVNVLSPECPVEEVERIVVVFDGASQQGRPS